MRCFRSKHPRWIDRPVPSALGNGAVTWLERRELFPIHITIPCPTNNITVYARDLQRRRLQ